MAFLVFEGIDCSGKSTLVAALDKELKKRKIEATFTKEPGGTALGQKIRQLLIENGDSPPDSKTEILLLFADRNQHIHEVIKPKVKKGEWVISDRYWASTFAYQCGGRQVDEAFVSDIRKSVCPPDCDPDLWILLDISIEESERRMKKYRSSLDRFELEDKSFHQRVRDYYLKISKDKSQNWLVLDATLTTEQLLEKVIMALEKQKLLKG